MLVSLDLRWSLLISPDLHWSPGLSVGLSGLPWSPVVYLGLQWSTLVSSGLCWSARVSIGLWGLCWSPWSPGVSAGTLIPSESLDGCLEWPGDTCGCGAALGAWLSPTSFSQQGWQCRSHVLSWSWDRLSLPWCVQVYTLDTLLKDRP